VSDQFGPLTPTPQQPLSRREAREAASAKPAKRTKAPATGGESAEKPEKTGIAALIAKHPTAYLIGALALAFVLLGTGAVALGVATGGTASASGPAAIIDDSVPRALPETLPAASRLRTCTIGDAASNEALKTLHASVINASTGEVLFNRAATEPARTASVLKALTGAAAISVLGPDYRLSTQVFEGSSPGTVVLVGGGDATLTRLNSGESVYKGAARVSALATQVVDAYTVAYPGVPITNIILDSSYWNPKDNWDASWSNSDRTNGYQSRVTALQVDGDRADPTVKVSARGNDPVKRAGEAFANAIAAASGQPVATLTVGTNASTTKLGEVQSQPVSTLVNQMLLTSDGTLAESLARVVSVKAGLGGSASSLQQAIGGAIQPLGMDVTTLTIVDGSGLSAKNAISPDFMARFMIAAKSGANDLQYVYNSLPIAGETGGLQNRFASSEAKGKVTAKPGHITSATTLAGVIEAKDGTTLGFAFYGIGDGIPDSAVGAVDALTTAVYECGDNLANN